MAGVLSVGSATSSTVLQNLRDGLTKQSSPKEQAPSTQTASTTAAAGTPQEEAMETYAETLREALSGDQQAMRKLAADQEKAATARAQTTSAKQGVGANGEAAATTQGTENEINTTA